MANREAQTMAPSPLIGYSTTCLLLIVGLIGGVAWAEEELFCIQDTRSMTYLQVGNPHPSLADTFGVTMVPQCTASNGFLLNLTSDMAPVCLQLRGHSLQVLQDGSVQFESSTMCSKGTVWHVQQSNGCIHLPEYSRYLTPNGVNSLNISSDTCEEGTWRFVNLATPDPELYCLQDETSGKFLARRDSLSAYLISSCTEQNSFLITNGTDAQCLKVFNSSFFLEADGTSSSDVDFGAFTTSCPAPGSDGRVWSLSDDGCITSSNAVPGVQYLGAYSSGTVARLGACFRWRKFPFPRVPTELKDFCLQDTDTGMYLGTGNALVATCDASNTVSGVDPTTTAEQCLTLKGTINRLSSSTRGDFVSRSSCPTGFTSSTYLWRIVEGCLMTTSPPTSSEVYLSTSGPEGSETVVLQGACRTWNFVDPTVATPAPLPSRPPAEPLCLREASSGMFLSRAADGSPMMVFSCTVDDEDAVFSLYPNTSRTQCLQLQSNSNRSTQLRIVDTTVQFIPDAVCDIDDPETTWQYSHTGCLETAATVPKSFLMKNGGSRLGFQTVGRSLYCGGSGTKWEMVEPAPSSRPYNPARYCLQDPFGRYLYRENSLSARVVPSSCKTGTWIWVDPSFTDPQCIWINETASSPGSNYYIEADGFTTSDVDWPSMVGGCVGGGERIQWRIFSDGCIANVGVINSNSSRPYLRAPTTTSGTLVDRTSSCARWSFTPFVEPSPQPVPNQELVCLRDPDSGLYVYRYDIYSAKLQQECTEDNAILVAVNATYNVTQCLKFQKGPYYIHADLSSGRYNGDVDVATSSTSNCNATYPWTISPAGCISSPTAAKSGSLLTFLSAGSASTADLRRTSSCNTRWELEPVPPATPAPTRVPQNASSYNPGYFCIQSAYTGKYIAFYDQLSASFSSSCNAASTFFFDPSYRAEQCLEYLKGGQSYFLQADGWSSADVDFPALYSCTASQDKWIIDSLGCIESANSHPSYAYLQTAHSSSVQRGVNCGNFNFISSASTFAPAIPGPHEELVCLRDPDSGFYVYRYDIYSARLQPECTEDNALVVTVNATYNVTQCLKFQNGPSGSLSSYYIHADLSSGTNSGDVDVATSSTSNCNATYPWTISPAGCISSPTAAKSGSLFTFLSVGTISNEDLRRTSSCNTRWELVPVPPATPAPTRVPQNASAYNPGYYCIQSANSGKYIAFYDELSASFSSSCNAASTFFFDPSYGAAQCLELSTNGQSYFLQADGFSSDDVDFPALYSCTASKDKWIIDSLGCIESANSHPNYAYLQTSGSSSTIFRGRNCGKFNFVSSASTFAPTTPVPPSPPLSKGNWCIRDETSKMYLNRRSDAIADLVSTCTHRNTFSVDPSTDTRQCLGLANGMGFLSGDGYSTSDVDFESSAVCGAPRTAETVVQIKGNCIVLVASSDAYKYVVAPSSPNYDVYRTNYCTNRWSFIDPNNAPDAPPYVSPTPLPPGGRNWGAAGRDEIYMNGVALNGRFGPFLAALFAVALVVAFLVCLFARTVCCRGAQRKSAHLTRHGPDAFEREEAATGFDDLAAAAADVEMDVAAPPPPGTGDLRSEDDLPPSAPPPYESTGQGGTSTPPLPPAGGAPSLPPAPAYHPYPSPRVDIAGIPETQQPQPASAAVSTEEGFHNNNNNSGEVWETTPPREPSQSGLHHSRDEFDTNDVDIIIEGGIDL